MVERSGKYFFEMQNEVRRKLGLAGIIFLFCSSLFAQKNDFFKIGDWRSYFMAGDYLFVEKGEESVIVANAFQLFLYYPETDEILILNKVSGLSQTGISAVKFMEGQGNIIVGYDNGNVDIIMPDRTLNMPGIRNNENILDSKKINDILVIKNRIFLATDFGIVEIDGEKYEFGS